MLLVRILFLVSADGRLSLFDLDLAGVGALARVVALTLTLAFFAVARAVVFASVAALLEAVDLETVDRALLTAFLIPLLIACGPGSLLLLLKREAGLPCPFLRFTPALAFDPGLDFF